MLYISTVLRELAMLDPAAFSQSMSDASDAEAMPEPTRPELPLPELEARITELAGHLNAAHHRFLALVAEFDRREGWTDGATRSCAHWLGWKCGIELGAAREKVRTARALESLPRIDAAMSRGELSYSKVRALTRVATPETEETLLMVALHGTSHHVESVVRGFRRAQQAVELDRDARQQASRGLTYRHDDDGSLCLQVRLPAEAGALVLRALQRVLDEDSADPRGRAHANSRPDVPAGTSGRAPAADPAGGAAAWPLDTSDTSDTLPPDTPSQRRADALARFAESWLAHGDRALAGGERQQIVVHVDARTLVADRPGRSELDDGSVLAAETVRRLGCDASLVTIVQDGAGHVLDVGRRTRSIPPAIARALRSRDRGCRYPGCTQQRFVDGHHIEHWAHGGATRLSNLVLLCRRHHRQVHEGGARVRMLNDGALLFVDALGRRIDDAPPLSGEPGWIVERHRRDGPPIQAGTASGQWRGERLDLGWTVAGLCAQQARTPPPP
jgi:hypothetical protein